MTATHHRAPRTRGRTRRLVCVAALASAAVLAITAPSAIAAPIDSGTFDFTDSSTFDDCGYTIAAKERRVGGYVVKSSTPASGGQFFGLQQKTNYFGVFTNVETGAYFTDSWHTTFTTLPATVMSDDDPDIVTYRTHETGVWDVIRDSSGKVRYRSTGNLVFEYVFDTGGDSTPGGELISEEFIRTSGNWQTFDAHFCDIADELIG
jgi:hypothetical protein